MAEQDNQEIAIDYIMRYSGKPYQWGGDDPMTGFDCSHLVCEYLKAKGKLAWKEYLTAAQLQERCKSLATPRRGALVFWKNSSGIVSHVGICLNSELYLGAEGGDSTTTDARQAAIQNAYVKVRAIAKRGGITLYGDID
jgi:cell wall-associated NlpC family hydrolase